MSLEILCVIVMDNGKLMAEYSEGKGGNTREVITKILYPKIDKEDGVRKTFKQSPYEFHFKNKDKRTIFAVTDAGFKRKSVWAFINEIEKEMTRLSIAANGSNVKKILIQKMKWYNNPENEKLIDLQIKMDNIKDATVENVDKLLKAADKENYRNDRDKLREGTSSLRKSKGGCFAWLGF